MYRAPSDPPTIFAEGKRNAFSLVEVVLAMGVVSIAFVTMVALLSTGLTTFHDATSTTVTSQIAQQLVNSVEQSGFSTLTSGANASTTYYFDEQGNELPSTSTSYVYEANVTVTPTTLLPGATTPNTNLATVKIQVATNPGRVNVNWNQTQPQPGVTIRTYSTQVANAS